MTPPHTPHPRGLTHARDQVMGNGARDPPALRRACLRPIDRGVGTRRPTAAIGGLGTHLAITREDLAGVEDSCLAPLERDCFARVERSMTAGSA
jgi:hypothetical protein